METCRYNRYRRRHRLLPPSRNYRGAHREVVAPSRRVAGSTSGPSSPPPCHEYPEIRPSLRTSAMNRPPYRAPSRVACAKSASDARPRPSTPKLSDHANMAAPPPVRAPGTRRRTRSVNPCPRPRLDVFWFSRCCSPPALLPRVSHVLPAVPVLSDGDKGPNPSGGSFLGPRVTGRMRMILYRCASMVGSISDVGTQNTWGKFHLRAAGNASTLCTP